MLPPLVENQLEKRHIEWKVVYKYRLEVYLRCVVPELYKRLVTHNLDRIPYKPLTP